MIKPYIILYLLFAATLIRAQALSVTLSKTETECNADEASITLITAALPVNYLWSNGALTSSITELADGFYSVTVTDANDDTTIYFSIFSPICEPIPASGFSPNYDGFYDNWSISRLENFPDFELFVYNRWGQQVHHQASTYISWDGKNLGIPLPDATYYYVLYFTKTDKSKFIKGAVSILK